MDSYISLNQMQLHGNCLNPYCSGRWPRTLADEIDFIDASNGGLILIVVEDGLVPIEPCELNQAVIFGLILIVVEDGLVPIL